MREMFKMLNLSSPANANRQVRAREGDPGGATISNRTNGRHRPLYAGDPIFFLAMKKMGCPDKPGNDGHFLRRGKLHLPGPLPLASLAQCSAGDGSVCL